MTAVALDREPRGIPPGTAAADVREFDFGPALSAARGATPAQVDDVIARASARARLSATDLGVLLSIAAGERLEELSALAHELTVRRFGRAVSLFAPLYLSNECVSTCTYCGFSAGNDIARRTLGVDEIVAEGHALAAQGFRHVLLVAGEHARIVSKDYLVAAVAALAPIVPFLSVEVQVWDTATYRRLVDVGCDGLVVYQESYDPVSYAAAHLRGNKRNYEWRLAAPDRGAEAGMRRLGIGSLLGLHPDWRAEALGLGVHARALVRRHWRVEVSAALPRLRPAAGGYVPARAVTDRELAQLVCALRLFDPHLGLSLSTREPPALRDGLVRLGITTMSAGSHTEPGGYASPSAAEPQFEISDTRAPADVAAALRDLGYDPVWKDWERAGPTGTVPRTVARSISRRAP